MYNNEINIGEGSQWGLSGHVLQSFTFERLRRLSEFGFRTFSHPSRDLTPVPRHPAARVLLAAADSPPHMSMLGMNSRRAFGPVGNSGAAVSWSTATVAGAILSLATGFIVTSSDRLVTTSWCVSNALTSWATENLFDEQGTENVSRSIIYII